MLLQAELDGFFGEGDFPVFEVMLNDLFELPGIKEKDVVGLQHGFEAGKREIVILVRARLHKLLFNGFFFLKIVM
jgi:hypothetical protein